MLARHVESNADLTVACIEVPIKEANAFGVMSIGDQDEIVDFSEKPENPEHIPGNDEMALASMGIYIFNTEFLYEQLIKDADDKQSDHDFGKNIIPGVIGKYRVIAYPFRDVQSRARAYWRDVGTLDAFWQANLELVDPIPQLNLYDTQWPIWTYQEQLPPAKFIHDDQDQMGYAVNSMVSGGCIISGAEVRHSLLFSNVRISSQSTVVDSVILPDVVMEQDCVIRKAIIDKGCHLPAGTHIGDDPASDAKKYLITPNGVTLVIPEMLGQEIHHVR